MRERFGLPAGDRERRQRRRDRRVAARRRARVDDMVMLTLGTGVGGGLILDGRPYRPAWAAEIGHVVVDLDGPPCQGTCTGPRPPRGARVRQRGDACARAASGPARTRTPRQARPRATSARRGARRIGRYLGAGIGALVNLFDPELVVVGGGFAAAWRPPARAGARGRAREALEPGRETVASSRPSLAPSAGLIGAGLVAFEALDTAATAARGLRDADRQPRGRDAARARRARRGRPRALRGHAPHAGPARPARDQGPALATTSTTRRATAELAAAARGRRADRARQRRRAAGRSTTPARGWSPRRSRRASR